jgi:hypothetical protein
VTPRPPARQDDALPATGQRPTRQAANLSDLDHIPVWIRDVRVPNSWGVLATIE